MIKSIFNEIFLFLQQVTGLSPNTQRKIFLSLAVFVLLWLLRFLILKGVWKKTDNVRTRYVWRKTLSYITVIITFFLILNIWFEGLEGLETYLGLVSAGIAIALRDPLTNITGWFFILIKKPITVGDRIQIGEHRGDVIDIGVFQITLLEIGNWVESDQSTGRMLHMPNSKIFVDPLLNYTRGFGYIWNEIRIIVTFESNWQEGKRILAKVVKTHSEQFSQEAEKSIKEASKQFMIFYSQLTPTVYTSVADNGVVLTMRYLCNPKMRRGSEENMWEAILEEFGKRKDIDFAYPTQRFYDNTVEGKHISG